jgi:hypothetical protein
MGYRSAVSGSSCEEGTPVALTDLKIKKANAKERSYKLYDSLGLFVFVKPNGSKLWRQKYQINGKERLKRFDINLRHIRPL